MEFKYVTTEGGVLRPYLPLVVSHKQKTFNTGALVDTGSDFTILPEEIAHYLEIQLDDSKAIEIGSAGGSTFWVLPSLRPVSLKIEARTGFRPIEWQSVIYFSNAEKIALFGHKSCIEKFDMNFFGPEKKFSILPRFKF